MIRARARSLVAPAALCAVVSIAVAVGRAQDKKHTRIEYVRVPLSSVFHAATDAETSLERGLLIGGPKGTSQGFRLPVEIPVGAVVEEVGVIAQTTNQLSVRLDRLDWSSVYDGSDTTPKDAGSWACVNVVDHSLVRKVAAPVKDGEDVKQELPKRDSPEQEIIISVLLSRNPSTTVEDRSVAASNQKDKVTAIWLKISH